MGCWHGDLGDEGVIGTSAVGFLLSQTHGSRKGNNEGCREADTKIRSGDRRNAQLYASPLPPFALQTVHSRKWGEGMGKQGRSEGERGRIYESGPFTVALVSNLGSWEAKAGGLS